MSKQTRLDHESRQEAEREPGRGDAPMNTLPLLGSDDLDAPIAWQGGRWISRGEFLAHAQALAAELPRGEHALGMCADRYYFMVALAALLLERRTALLPSSTAPRTVAEIGRPHNAFRLDDAAVAAAIAKAGTPLRTVPEVDARHTAIVLYTSGSTGQPTPQAKTWAEVAGATQRALARFAFAEQRHDIVATVPAQHSYGLESSVLYAMLSPCTIHAARPLYPADVHAALAQMRAPRVLVTTPLHLSACVRAGLEWPPITCVVSATAPLDRPLAEASEKTLGAPVFEIYGCSEAGAIASRRTRTETAWLPYAGMRLQQTSEGLYVHGEHLPQPRALADIVDLAADGHFELRGRKADHIKVAGKRISLAELNRRLLAIEGVQDGSFIAPDNNRRERLAAVVVAPHLSEEAIRAQLAESLDPVFLPRPLVRVSALERNATGKLPRAELLRLLETRLAPSEAKGNSSPDADASRTGAGNG